jgi:hypothetical protein
MGRTVKTFPLWVKEKGKITYVVLREAAGIRKNRKDLPDFKAARAEWDRT